MPAALGLWRPPAPNPQVFDDLATAFARANNLREIGLGTGYKKAELTAVETALAEAVATAEGNVAAALADDRYADALVALAALRAPVDERLRHHRWSWTRIWTCARTA